jgi:hypothetical protein
MVKGLGSVVVRGIGYSRPSPRFGVYAGANIYECIAHLTQRKLAPPEHAPTAAGGKQYVVITTMLGLIAFALR